MELEALFEAAVAALRERHVPFAVAGGFAADIYRGEHRVTQDIDMLMLASEQPLAVAEGIIREMGLSPAILPQADLAGGPLFAIRRRSTEPCMVVGRSTGGKTRTGLDILLPAMPWVPDAVRRAQSNLIDFGFGRIPTITVEDVILSKCIAVNGASHRFKDLDDLVSIFSVVGKLDIQYLAGQIQRFSMGLPKTIIEHAPATLVSALKRPGRS